MLLNKEMRVFLTGSLGQVGWELNRGLLPYGAVHACDKHVFDLLDEDELRRRIRYFRPNVIINAAAYTAVDKAETERDLCRRLNVEVPRILAEEAGKSGAWVVHYSTDYVWNGNNDKPWKEDDKPDPVNYYGQSKLDGDMAVTAAAPKHLIFRTSWLYASRGSNFLLTMLRLFKEKPEIRVVCDQTGAPTWARYIAQSTIRAIKQAFDADGANLSGIYNMACSGAVTWYDFARAIKEYGEEEYEAVKITPVSSGEYPAPVKRPKWSALSQEKIGRVFGISPLPWHEAMKLCMDEVADRRKYQ